ncbi:Alpha-glucosidase [Arthrobotrys entomopaga]|nr:Alpha-glucosidase [Arthrobotrys entomopaga]
MICRIAGSAVQPVWAQYTPQKRGEEMDKVMKNANNCFLVGKVLLVVPVVTPRATSVTAWIPAGVWYDMLTGAAIASHEDQWVELDAPLSRMPMLVHGGTIIPMHFNKTGKTTVDFRAGGFSLLVALDAYGHADGYLYLDDGEHYDSKQSWITLKAELTLDTGNLVIETTSDEIFEYKPRNENEYMIREVVLMAVGTQPRSLDMRMPLWGRMKHFVEV